jgi:V/A-type H+-transporting ATPase subunit E
MVEEILREASERAADIVTAAKKEATTVIHAAGFTAKEEEEREVKEAQARGERIYEEVLIDSKIKAKKEALQKREEIINEVFREAEKKLRKYTSSKKYQADLIRLAIDSYKKLGSNQVVIYANERDLRTLKRAQKRITQALSTKGATVSVSFGRPIQAIGGVRVATADGKVEIDDTFEGRMRRDFDTLRVKVARLLFEGSK